MVAEAAPDPDADDSIVLLGVGTNLGDRAVNLRRALAALGRVVEIDSVSRVYESEPVGVREQPVFWNLVVRARTQLTAAALLSGLKQIEYELGRRASFRNAPRVIDLDILTCDGLILHTQELELPHPRLHERTFVLYPLAEVEPEFRHPRSGHTVAEMLAELKAPTRAVPLDRSVLEEDE